MISHKSLKKINSARAYLKISYLDAVVFHVGSQPQSYKLHNETKNITNVCLGEFLKSINN